VRVDFFLNWESGTSSELSGNSDRVGKAVFQQKQYIGATISTENVYRCLVGEKDLQDIRS